MTTAYIPVGAATDFKNKLATEAPLQPLTDLQTWQRTVIFAPHPDDESLGCGGLIALLTQLGHYVCVVFISDGAMSHPNSTKYDAAARTRLRREEATRACTRLGVAAGQLHFLNYPDTRVPRRGAVGFEAAAERVKELLADREFTHALVPWRRDPHCDHRATYEICRAAVSQLPTPPQWVEYPIWMWNSNRMEEMPGEEEIIAFRIDVSTTYDTKWAAIEEHVSQLTNLIDDDPEGFTLSAEMLDNFRHKTEVFFVDADKRGRTLGEDYFNEVYRQEEDPWSFETSAYEHEKYAQTIDALPRLRYARGLEIGCSIGVLTEKLAERCDELLSVDVAEAPLVKARLRLAGSENVQFQRIQIPEAFPEGAFDLVVVSEVGYYWNPADLTLAIGKIQRSLLPGGALVLVHYTPYVPDYPLTGDEVHQAFEEQLDRHFHRVKQLRTDRYRLDVYQRTGGENPD